MSYVGLFISIGSNQVECTWEQSVEREATVTFTLATRFFPLFFFTGHLFAIRCNWSLLSRIR